MNIKPIIEIENLTYSYGTGERALDGVNVEIRTGEKIAVLGANGAGKSTFFLNLNGVLSPESGTIRLKGTEITKKNLRELRKSVGIVFQDADSQIIASTVFEEVSFGPMNMRLEKDEVRRRTESALRYMNLETFAHRASHYLSGGEKKRVTIADIIAMEPEVIVFDEPATALDPVNQQALEEVLLRLNSEGKTLILSTHDVDFAYRFADRILVFCDGRVIADSSPVKIFRNAPVLRAANLKKPVLFELYEILMEKRGKTETEDNYPKTVKEFSELL